jgi:HPt (histidine-containing phosphotransfer) domain-containing protein
VAQIAAATVPGAVKAQQYEESVRLLAGEMHFSTAEIRRLLDGFFLLIPEFFEQMDSALHEKSIPGISALAHQMKGISSNLRLREIQAACVRLEAAAKDEFESTLDAANELKAFLTAYSQAHQRE